MVSKGKKKGSVKFSIKPTQDAASVYLAGAFRQWQPVPMKKQKDGHFALEVALPPGRHEYKFVVDGKWTTDPDHNLVIPNAFGSANSVAHVE
jgi:1,4-alpha-glucan branching enzyme